MRSDMIAPALQAAAHSAYQLRQLRCLERLRRSQPPRVALMHETYAVRARVRADRRSPIRNRAGEEVTRLGRGEQLGDVVEVRYLHAAQVGGALYQPVLLGVRDDVEADECVVAQLKLKAS